MPPPTPDELIAAEPPPAFPPWMVAADPRLAAQDTNRIYQAFRRRRVLHPRAHPWLMRARFRRGDFRRNTFSFVFMLVVFAVAYRARVYFPTIPEWVPYIVVLSLFPTITMLMDSLTGADRRGVAAQRDGKLPRKVSEGFEAYTQTIDPELLVVLSEVAASGREVLEAIYLEHREAEWRITRWGFGLMGLPGCAPILIGWLVPATPTFWPVAPSLIWMGWCAVMRYNHPRTHRPVRPIHALIRNWQSVHPPYQELLGRYRLWRQRDFADLLKSMWRVAALVLAIVLIIAAMLGLWASLGGSAVGVAAIFVMLAVAIAFPLSLRRQTAIDERRLAQLFSEADEAFAFFADWSMTNDPDEWRGYMVRRGLIGPADPWPSSVPSPDRPS